MSKQASIKTTGDNGYVTIWNRAFISVFIANMLMQMGQQMMNTLVSKYANYLGATPSVVGFVASAFAYTALFFKLFAGPLIDNFNKKKVLLGAMCIMMLAFLGYSMSSTINILVGSRLLQGVGQAFSATCCLALASDALPKEKMGSGIAYFTLGQAICQAIGPNLGLRLVGIIGYRPTFAFGAGTMLLAVVACLMIKVNYLPKEKKDKKFQFKNIIAVEALIPGLLAFFLSISYYNINSFLAIFGEQRGFAESIGNYFTVYAVILFISRPIVGKLSDKFGFAKVLPPAMFCFALSFVLISYSDRMWMFLLSAVLSSFGFGASHPAIQALCMKSVPQERRGAGSTTNFIFQDLGTLVGPVVAGFIIERSDYVVMWRAMTIPVLAAIIVVLLFRKKIDKLR